MKLGFRDFWRMTESIILLKGHSKRTGDRVSTKSDVSTKDRYGVQKRSRPCSSPLLHRPWRYHIFSWIISATKETLNLNIFLWNSFIYGTCCLFCIVCSWKKTLLKGKDVKITELIIISWLCELWTWIFLHIDYKMGFLVYLSEERFVTFWTVIWEGRRG